MKAAIGNSLLVGIIVVFLSIVFTIIVASITYSKAFRIKNRIVDIIEKNEVFNSDVQDEINEVLRQIGYKTNAYMDNSRCSNYGPEGNLVNGTSPYHYCVFKFTSDRGGEYYKVVSFAYVEFPIISAFQLSVSGETKIFYNA